MTEKNHIESEPVLDFSLLPLWPWDHRSYAKLGVVGW